MRWLCCLFLLMIEGCTISAAKYVQVISHEQDSWEIYHEVVSVFDTSAVFRFEQSCLGMNGFRYLKYRSKNIAESAEGGVIASLLYNEKSRVLVIGYSYIPKGGAITKQAEAVYQDSLAELSAHIKNVDLRLLDLQHDKASAEMMQNLFEQSAEKMQCYSVGH